MKRPKMKFKKAIDGRLKWYENIYGMIIDQALLDYASGYKELLGVEGNAERFLFNGDLLETQLLYFGYPEGLISTLREKAKQKRREYNESKVKIVTT